VMIVVRVIMSVVVPMSGCVFCFARHGTAP
jgi:hypothetical protein